MKEEWDNVAKAPYLYNPTTGTFFTYDNPRSVTEKGEYVKANGLGGLIGWMASQDATTSTGKRDELSTVAWNVLFGNASRPSYNIGPAAISVTVSLSNYTANGRNGYNVTLTNTATLTETDSVLRAVESRAKTVKLPKIYFITESNATFTTGGYPTGAVSNVDGVGIVDMATVYDNQFLAPGTRAQVLERVGLTPKRIVREIAETYTHLIAEPKTPVEPRHTPVELVETGVCLDELNRRVPR